MDIVETVRTELRAAADTFSIGKSERGNDILCAHCGGHGGRQIIITAGIHARVCSKISCAVGCDRVSRK